MLQLSLTDIAILLILFLLFIIILVWGVRLIIIASAPRRFKIQFLSIIFSIIFFTLLFSIVVIVLPEPWDDYLAWGGYITLMSVGATSLWVVYFIMYKRQKNQTGELLLDLGRPPILNKSFLWSNCIILLTFINLYTLFFDNRQLYLYADYFELNFPLDMVLLSLGIYYLLESQARREIKERGIGIVGFDIIGWNSIIDYAWQGRNESQLIIKYKNRLFYIWEKSIQIPRDFKDNVNKILEQKINKVRVG